MGVKKPLRGKESRSACRSEGEEDGGGKRVPSGREKAARRWARWREERGSRGKEVPFRDEESRLGNRPPLGFEGVALNGDVIFLALITSADGIGVIFNPQD